MTGSTTVRRRAGAVLAGVLAIAVIGIGAARADDTDLNDPKNWPTTAGSNPSIDTLADAIRYSGNNRYETNLSTALTTIGTCNFPYFTANRNGGNKTSLTGDTCWYGAKGAPQAIIVTAGDRFPDSLSAAALSSPGDHHHGPNLTPIGGNAVTNDIGVKDAPIIVTNSGREGATTLSDTAAIAAARLKATATSAIIVGGPLSVPTGVEAQLSNLGYTVYRIAGDDRFGTAAAVAAALGTGGATTAGCGDTNAADGVTSSAGFPQNLLAQQENAAPEYWSDATHCTGLPQTVVLVDGVTGADALASGWATSWYGMPTLLVGTNGELPPATQSALQNLTIQNIIVLGGTARIPDATVAQAATLAGIAITKTIRIAGSDRYDTSVQLAKHLAGWFPFADSTVFKGDMFCLAPSAGEGDGASGWPDDLGAGPLCANLSPRAATNGRQPQRQLPPVSGTAHSSGGGSSVVPNHDLVPMLLAPTGASALTFEVSDFLAAAFPNGQAWCTGNGGTCSAPGFVVSFGGGAVLTDSVFRQAAKLASGGTYSLYGDAAPTVAGPFFTKLDLSPVYNNGSGAATNKVCANLDALKDVEFMAIYSDATLESLLASYDVATNGQYVGGTSQSVCVKTFDDASDHTVTFAGDSLSGHFSTPKTINYLVANSFTMSAALAGAGGPTNDSTTWGDDSASTTVGDETIEDYDLATSGTPPTLAVKGTTCHLDTTAGTSTVSLDFTRISSTKSSFTASFTLSTTDCGDITGTAVGLASFVAATTVPPAPAKWQFRGKTTITSSASGHNINGATGGFTVDLSSHSSGDNSTDALSGFQVDAILP